MKTTLAVTGRDGTADAPVHLVTRNHRGDQVLAPDPPPLSHRQQHRNYAAARMRDRRLVDVVEADAVERHAVGEGGIAHRRLEAAGENRRLGVAPQTPDGRRGALPRSAPGSHDQRSEEHTSEL